MFNTTYWKFIDRSWKRNRNGNSLNFLVILGYAQLSYFGGDPTHLDHSPKSTKDEQAGERTFRHEVATTMTKPRHWSSPDVSCFWQRIWKESDNSTSVPDENASRDNFTFQGLHQEDDSCPPDESTRSSSSLYSALKQCNNDFISSTMKILLQMSTSDKKTQDDLLKDWIARTLASTKRGGYLDLTDMLEVFYQLNNHVKLILAALDKSFGHLDISGILPTNLYYFLESEDERKNPSWKRRMHRFHSRINVNQIFHLNDMLYLSKNSYAGSIEEIKEGCNAAAEPLELIFCDLESRPNRPSHFIAVKKN
jgi:hypothetical protein